MDGAVRREVGRGAADFGDRRPEKERRKKELCLRLVAKLLPVQLGSNGAGERAYAKSMNEKVSLRTSATVSKGCLLTKPQHFRSLRAMQPDRGNFCWTERKPLVRFPHEPLIYQLVKYKVDQGTASPRVHLFFNQRSP